MKTNTAESVSSKTTHNKDFNDLNKTINHHLKYGLFSLVILLLGMYVIYVWQHNKVISVSNSLNTYQAVLVKDSLISLDNLNALRALPNIVVDSVNSPADLIAFLGADNTQCYKNNENGYYKVIAQTKDQFAEMEYGCTAKGGTTPVDASPAHILAKKVDNKWSLISPTNQWLPFNKLDVPSCVMVNDNKVSKLVTPVCWQGPSLQSPGTFNAREYSVVPVTSQ